MMADEPRDEPVEPEAVPVKPQTAPPETGDDRDGTGREWLPPEVEDLPALEELDLRR